MLTEAKLNSLLKEQKELEDAYDALDKKHEDLCANNKDNCDARENARKSKGRMSFLAALSLIAAIVGYFIIAEGMLKFLIPVAGAVLFVISLILRSGSAKKEKELSVVLTDFDNAAKRFREEKSEISNKLASIKKDLKIHEKEKQYQEYEGNHVCVCIGWSWDNKPTSSKYTHPSGTLVYIDEIEVGCTKKPFEAFYVEPGVHAVKMYAREVLVGRNLSTETIKSTARQVKVTEEKSAYLLYHWSFYERSDRTTGSKLYIIEYDNMGDFLEAIHAL